jgi:hypothetical protein
VAAFLVGRWRDDRLLHHLALAATIAGDAGFALVSADWSDLRPARLLVHLGFGTLLLAVMRARFGSDARRLLGRWWRSLLPAGAARS